MGQVTPYNMNHFNRELASIIKQYANTSNPKQRLEHYCNSLLGRPYRRWCIGDGPHGLYNQKPMYRTDYFDCVTWVNTILALVNAHNIHEFVALYLRQQYRGPCCFLNRNYFIESHWIEANIKDQRISHLNDQLAHQWQQPLQIASTTIDIPGWLHHHQANDIHLLQTTETNIQKRLLRLHAYAKLTQPISNELTYFSIKSLQQLQPKNFLNLPPLIAMIVRPNWDVRSLIGTHLNISHLGICLSKQDQSLSFYHASSDLKQVVETDFFKYIQFCKKNIPSVKGIYFAGIKA